MAEPRPSAVPGAVAEQQVLAAQGPPDRQGKEVPVPEWAQEAEEVLLQPEAAAREQPEAVPAAGSKVADLRHRG